jgi:Domain of unknown function (DUF4274)
VNANAIKLAAKSLPDDAAEKLIAQILADVGRPLRRGPTKPVADRMLATLAESLVAELAFPKPLRGRLEREADKRLRAGQSAREVGAALDAIVSPVLDRLVERAVKRLPAFSRQVSNEAALHADALALHKQVTKGWRYAHERAAEIVGHDTCALGTALFTYWLCKPHYYRQFKTRTQAAPHERDTWQLLREIERRVAAADFPHASIPFDPRKTPAGDLTKDEYKKLPRLRELPEHMYLRVTETTIALVPPRK